MLRAANPSNFARIRLDSRHSTLRESIESKLFCPQLPKTKNCHYEVIISYRLSGHDKFVFTAPENSGAYLNFRGRSGAQNIGHVNMKYISHMYLRNTGISPCS